MSGGAAVWSDLLLVAGVLLLIEGLPWFAFPVTAQRVIAQLLETDASDLRAMGFVMMVVGLILLALRSRLF